MINPYNIEDYILSYVDGELSPDEERVLQQYLRQNPSYLDMLEEYQSLKIEKPTTVYAKKGQLVKKEKPLALIWSSVAAAVLVLIVLLNLPKELTHDQVAKTKKPKTKTSVTQKTTQDTLSLVKNTPRSKKMSRQKQKNRVAAAVPQSQTTTHPTAYRKVKKSRPSEQNKPSNRVQVYTLNKIANRELSSEDLLITDPEPIEFQTFSIRNIEVTTDRKAKNILAFQFKNTQSIKSTISQIQNIVSAYRSLDKDSTDYTLVINLNNFLKI